MKCTPLSNTLVRRKYLAECLSESVASVTPVWCSSVNNVVVRVVTHTGCGVAHSGSSVCGPCFNLMHAHMHGTNKANQSIQSRKERKNRPCCFAVGLLEVPPCSAADLLRFPPAFGYFASLAAKFEGGWQMGMASTRMQCPCMGSHGYSRSLKHTPNQGTSVVLFCGTRYWWLLRRTRGGEDLHSSPLVPRPPVVNRHPSGLDEKKTHGTYYKKNHRIWGEKQKNKKELVPRVVVVWLFVCFLLFASCVVHVFSSVDFLLACSCPSTATQPLRELNGPRTATQRVCCAFSLPVCASLCLSLSLSGVALGWHALERRLPACTHTTLNQAMPHPPHLLFLPALPAPVHGI